MGVALHLFSINFSNPSRAYEKPPPGWEPSYRSQPDASLPFTSSVLRQNYLFELICQDIDIYERIVFVLLVLTIHKLSVKLSDMFI